MEQGDGERDAPLLAAAQRMDVTIARRQVQQIGQKLQLRFNKARPQIIDATKVLEGLLDGEKAVQCQLLRHVTDSRAGDAALRSAGFVTQYQHLSAVEAPATDYATQKGRLAAPTSPEQSVSAKELD